MANLDYSNKQYVKQSQLGIPIGNKVVLGQLTSYTDGTAKWTYAKDTNPIIAGPGDRSTFTLYKDDNGKWNWTPTTSSSVSNLANREGFTEQQVKDSLYKTPQTQTVLNAGNVTQLGGIKEAQKLGVPGTTGKSTQVGTLPSTVSGNFAGQPDATTANQQPATGEDPTKIKDVNTGSEIGRNEKGTYGNLIYPLDIGSTAQDVIRFTIQKYQPSGLNISGALSGGSTLSGNRADAERTSLGTITLAIPGGISDTNTVNWGNNELNAFQALEAKIAFDSISGGLGKGVDAIKTAAAGAAGAGNEDLKSSLTSFITAAATQGSGNVILGRTQGSVFNPNLELLFNGPDLRAFNFTFKMSARSKLEADMIVKIIRAFKQSMSVQKTTSSIFLKAPNTYKIAYLRRTKGGDGGTVHTRIGKIKECALRSLTTNYAPEGQYAVYNDGTPISYEIQMQFAELEPVFNDDYGKDSTEIGF